VLGPLLEPEQTAVEPEALRDRRIPALTAADRPRLEILPDPKENPATRPADSHDLDVRLADIQQNLNRLEAAIAAQSQRSTQVDAATQTELLRLLREAHETAQSASQPSRLSEPEFNEEDPKTPSEADDRQPATKVKDYDADESGSGKSDQA